MQFGQQQSPACRLWEPNTPPRAAEPLLVPKFTPPPPRYVEHKVLDRPFSWSCLSEDLSQATLSPPKNWMGIFTVKSVVQLWSAQSFLKRIRGPGARSLFTDNNHYHKQKNKGSGPADCSQVLHTSWLCSGKCHVHKGFCNMKVHNLLSRDLCLIIRRARSIHWKLMNRINTSFKQGLICMQMRKS